MRSENATDSLATAPDGFLDEVAGSWQVKHRLLRTVVAPLQSFAAGDAAVSPPSGVLVHGPAGCGVGLIARCLAEHLSATLDVHLVQGLDDLAGTRPEVVDRLFEGGAEGSERSFVVATSHRPWLVPEWLLGHGCIDRMVFVAPPDPLLAADSPQAPAYLAWLAEARSLAVFRRERGLVDDLIAFLQRHRLG